MSNVNNNPFAQAAVEAFNSAVDTLVIQKLTNLPNLGATGASLAQEGAVNAVPNAKPETGRTI